MIELRRMEMKIMSVLEKSVSDKLTPQNSFLFLIAYLHIFSFFQGMCISEVHIQTLVKKLLFFACSDDCHLWQECDPCKEVNQNSAVVQKVQSH